MPQTQSNFRFRLYWTPNPQWGAASALGIELLIVTLVILWLGKSVLASKISEGG